MRAMRIAQLNRWWRCNVGDPRVPAQRCSIRRSARCLLRLEVEVRVQRTAIVEFRGAVRAQDRAEVVRYRELALTHSAQNGEGRVLRARPLRGSVRLRLGVAGVARVVTPTAVELHGDDVNGSPVVDTSRLSVDRGAKDPR